MALTLPAKGSNPGSSDLNSDSLTTEQRPRSVWPVTVESLIHIAVMKTNQPVSLAALCDVDGSVGKIIIIILITLLEKGLNQGHL